MVTCPVCGGEKIKEDGTCVQCDSYLAPLHRIKKLPETYFSEGMELKEKGQIDEAIRKMIIVQSLNPEDICSHLELASLYVQKGLHADAIRQYEKVLEIEPGNEEAGKELEAVKRNTAQYSDKEKSKRKLTYAGYGIALIAGALIFFSAQSILKSPLQGRPLVSTSEQVITNNQSEPDKKITYIIQKGDSLSSIARKRYGSEYFWQKIYEKNNDKIKNPDRLSIGDEIILSEIIVQPKF